MRADYSPSGHTPEDLRTGDVLLVRRSSHFGWLVFFAQGAESFWRDPACTFTHAALVIDDEGTLAESVWNGVRETHVSRYEPEEYVLVRAGVNDHDAGQILRYASEVLAAKEFYGYLTVLSILISLATGTKFAFSLSENHICSGFVCSALTRAGFVWPKTPSHMTPADLAIFFEVG